MLAGDWLAGPSGGGGASINTPFLRPQGTYGGVPQQLVSCYRSSKRSHTMDKTILYGRTHGCQLRSYRLPNGSLPRSWLDGNIILQGKIYYAPRTTDHATLGYTVVDLYTGETLYEENNTKPAFGQVYNYESPNQHGGFAYLWRTSGQTITNPGGVNGTVWTAIDPYDGSNSIQDSQRICNRHPSLRQRWKHNATTTLSTTELQQSPDYHLTIWNSSAIPSELLGDSGTNYWQWRPATGGRGQLSWRRIRSRRKQGFLLNVSIPSPYNDRNSLLNETGTVRCIRESDY